MEIILTSWVLGISSLILLALGYTYSILFWIKYIYVKKMLVPMVAIVAFCSGSFYLGPSVSFISLLITGQNISGYLYYILSYVWMPIGTIGIVQMALNVFYPKYQKIAFIFYGIIAVIYWIFMFGFGDAQFQEEQLSQTGELLDISHTGVSLIVTAISLISVLTIDSAGFFLLARKLKKNNMPKKGVRKTFMIGLGWLLFVVSGVMDAMVPPNTVGIIVFVRGLMIVAFNFINLGFWSKPVRLESKS
ncbi:MAG: hypothetical protein K9W44_00120 [Candidatus Lokiarchaeota archaeon]|nr:hypothetical protein [Candidatus Harpocratesius repetitus]